MVLTGQPRPRPSLMLVPGLRSLPFWTSFDGKANRVAYQDPLVGKVVKHLESNYELIRQEYIEKSKSVFSDYDVSGRGGEHADDALHKGTWDWHSYMLKGKVQAQFIQHFGATASILQQLRDDDVLFEGTPFGFAFLSRLAGKSSIQPHTAPMNFRLRLHLPLVVPPEEGHSSYPQCGIRVGSSVQRWVEGKALVLDDSYEHEVWNDTDSERVLLLVDVWHPDLKAEEKSQITGMFLHAQEQGWLKDGDRE